MIKISMFLGTELLQYVGVTITEKHIVVGTIMFPMILMPAYFALILFAMVQILDIVVMGTKTVVLFILVSSFYALYICMWLNIV